jgi:hypothetical protein
MNSPLPRIISQRVLRGKRKVDGDVRNAVIVSSTESNCEVAFISERVEEGIAAGNSGFSDRCKCIWNT